MKEEDIQKQVIQYCRSKHKSDFFIFSIPNELLMKLRSYVPQKIRFMMISKLKAMGFVSGLPDLVVIGKRARVCVIELKDSNGELRDSQKRVFPMLEKFSGKIEICRSLNDVLSVLKKKKFIE